jgi:hypothetical protein
MAGGAFLATGGDLLLVSGAVPLASGGRFPKLIELFL